jgi:tetratricopeptide (TPR) repeat protein
LIEGLLGLQSIQWDNENQYSIQAYELRGQFEDALDRPDDALHSYGQGINLTARLLNRLSHFHYQRGMVYLHQAELTLAAQEAIAAEFEAMRLWAKIREQEGRYDEAYGLYCDCLNRAQRMGDHAALAGIEEDLASLLGMRQQKLDEATIYFERATDYYERVRDQLKLMHLYSNWAGVLLQNKQYAGARRYGQQAYQFLKSVQDLAASNTAANLAEACYYLSDFTAAETFAYEAMDYENPSSFGYAKYTLGLVMYARGAFVDAVTCFYEVAKLATAQGDLFLTAYTKRELGQVYKKMGSAIQARQELDNALQLFRQIKMEEEITTTLRYIEQL